LHVLYLQILAALLMGADYFLPSRIIKRIEAYFGPSFRGMHASVGQTVEGGFAILRVNKRRLIFAGICFITLIGANALLKYLGPFELSPLTVILYLLSRVTLICGSLSATGVLIDVLGPLGLGLPVSGLLKFINECPRGLIPATGMCCLLMSFTLQYYYLS
jgi:hypothetical protein